MSDGYQDWMPAVAPAASDLMLPRVASPGLDPRSVSGVPAAEMSRPRVVLLLGTVLLGVLGGAALLLAVVIQVP